MKRPDRTDWWMATVMTAAILLLIFSLGLIVSALALVLGWWVLIIPAGMLALTGIGWVVSFCLVNFVKSW